MQANTVYNITVNNITDCKNNPIGQKIKLRLDCQLMQLQTEMVINEILFNPKSGGYDYVEFYNRSNKIFDAYKLYVANRNSSGVISSIRLISSITFLYFSRRLYCSDRRCR